MTLPCENLMPFGITQPIYILDSEKGLVSYDSGYREAEFQTAPHQG